MAAIGLIATVPAFIIRCMRLEGRWSLTMAVAPTLFIYGLFDQVLAIRGRRRCSAWHCQHSKRSPERRWRYAYVALPFRRHVRQY